MFFLDGTACMQKNKQNKKKTNTKLKPVCTDVILHVIGLYYLTKVKGK